jgi:hypothetical protein
MTDDRLDALEHDLTALPLAPSLRTRRLAVARALMVPTSKGSSDGSDRGVPILINGALMNGARRSYGSGLDRRAEEGKEERNRGEGS